MIAVREPILKPVSISSLRPTQITVGMRESMTSASVYAGARRKRSASFLATT